MNELNLEWENFCDDDLHESTIEPVEIQDLASNVPKCSDIYISTKTKIGFLSKTVNLYDTFWKLPIIPYHLPKPGIVKKQMKFNSKSEKELQETINHIDPNLFHEHHIINRIVNPEGRISYKDIRKISIGLCKKDILSYRSKKKSAFYNCFVLILRIKLDDEFKEIHIKVFNTGKLEIPGIRDDEVLKYSLNLLTKILNEYSDKTIYCKDNYETVLINSNFNCGYFINRDKLLDILKYKYKIDCIFDSCQYPGIQCKYLVSKNDIDYKLSFMIFRTGSVLIVGKCSDSILEHIYIFIKNILETEYSVIGGPCIEKNDTSKDSLTKKIRKKIIVYT